MSQASQLKQEIIIVGYYNHNNIGDEQYKHSFDFVLQKSIYKNENNHSIRYLDCDLLPVINIDENAIIILGGGDVLNEYFLDKLNIKFANKKNKILAVSVGIPYDNIYLYQKHKLEIFTAIFLRTKQELEIFATHYYPERIHYIPDISIYLDSNYLVSRTPLCDTYTEYSNALNRIKTQYMQKRIIAITLNRHIYDPRYKEQYYSIVTEFATLINEFIAENYFVVLLPFNCDVNYGEDEYKTNMENDVLFHNDVMRTLREIPENTMVNTTVLENYVFNIDFVLTVEETLSLYEYFYFTIPMRFHAVLFSIYKNVPLVPIFTTKKIKNILLDIGWNDYCELDKNTDDIPTRFHRSEFYKSYGNVIAKHSEWKQQLKLANENLKQFGETSLEILKNVLENPEYIMYVSNENKIQNARDKIYRFMEENILGCTRNHIRTSNRTIFENFSKIQKEEDREVAVEIASYYLTGRHHSVFNDGLMEKMFEETYNYFEEWKWICENLHYNDEKNAENGIKLPNNKSGRELFNVGYISQDDTSGAHRSGWKFVYDNIKQYHNEFADTLLDLYVDRTFHWKRRIFKYTDILPYKKKWIGVIHHTFDTTFSEYNNTVLFQCPEFIESLKCCAGLVVLSNTMKTQVVDALKKTDIEIFTHIPVHCLVHPTEFTGTRFTLGAFLDNPDKKIMHIGGWLRNIFSFYMCNITDKYVFDKDAFLQKNQDVHCSPFFRSFFGDFFDSLFGKKTKNTHTLRKVAIKGKYMNNYFPIFPIFQHGALMDGFEEKGSHQETSKKCSRQETSKKCSRNELYRPQNNWIKHLNEYISTILETVEILDCVDNSTYDKLLSENIVFLHLVDASAVNTLLECIVRNTPIIINRHPAVVELLGNDYPLYYEGTDYDAMQENIKKMLKNTNIIRDAHNHICKIYKNQFMIGTFVKNFVALFEK
jgi:hypothetical protein